MKDFPHMLHVNGVSPVWERSWTWEEIRDETQRFSKTFFYRMLINLRSVFCIYSRKRLRRTTQTKAQFSLCPHSWAVLFTLCIVGNGLNFWSCHHLFLRPLSTKVRCTTMAYIHLFLVLPKMVALNLIDAQAQQHSLGRSFREE